VRGSGRALGWASSRPATTCAGVDRAGQHLQHVVGDPQVVLELLPFEGGMLLRKSLSQAFGGGTWTVRNPVERE